MRASSPFNDIRIAKNEKIKTVGKVTFPLSDMRSFTLLMAVIFEMFRRNPHHLFKDLGKMILIKKTKRVGN